MSSSTFDLAAAEAVLDAHSIEKVAIVFPSASVAKEALRILDQAGIKMTFTLAEQTSNSPPGAPRVNRSRVIPKANLNACKKALSF